MNKALIIAAITFLSGGATGGTLWKCTDEKGLVVYTATGDPDKCKILVRDDDPSDQRKKVPPSPVEQYRGHSLTSLFLCKLTQSAGLVTGDTRQSASCIKDAKTEAKQSFTKALRTLKKPKAQEALKSYHVAYVTALDGMEPGFEERKISYEQRQKALEDKVTEAWARFEVEQ